MLMFIGTLFAIRLIDLENDMVATLIIKNKIIKSGQYNNPIIIFTIWLMSNKCKVLKLYTLKKCFK